jgi:exodeoxyribonuclease VII large subunit
LLHKGRILLYAVGMASDIVTNIPEWTVSELSGALKRTLEDAYDHVRVRGEIGKVTVHGSGHVYLDIKDDRATLASVIWRGNAAKLKFRPEMGMEVIATGKITTFPGQSKYQLIIESLAPAGVGALLAQLEERRKRLAAEGLFAEERKKPLPYLPRVIGVVTSPTGAVIRDILHRLTDRFPRHVLLWPVRVQGETCAAEVANAIRGLNAIGPEDALPRPDLIIVARGGGSIEDLWGFNEEIVVRAAAASAIPLIAAVGHETDWTLIDHAADRRAPTPTGAAEMAVPVRAELMMRTGDVARRLGTGLLRFIETKRRDLRAAARALASGSDFLNGPRQRLDLAGTKLGGALERNAQRHRLQLIELARRLARLSPEARLAAMAARIEGLGKRLGAAREANLRAERRLIAERGVRVSDLLARRDRAMRIALDRRADRLGAMAQLFGSYNYHAVLDRGFALVRDAAGHPVRGAGHIADGARYEIEFCDGRGVVTGGAPDLSGPDLPPVPEKGKARAGRATGPGQGSLF